MAWMMEFFACGQRTLEDSTPSSQGRLQKVNALVRMVWGLAMLNVAPPKQFLDTIMIESQFLDTILIESQVNFPNFDGPNLSGLCWALCRMDITPPGFWVDDLLSFSRKQLPSFSMNICFTTLSGLCPTAVLWSISRLLNGDPTGAAFREGQEEEEVEEEVIDMDGKPNEKRSRGIPEGASDKWLRKNQPIIQDLAECVSQNFGQLEGNDLVDAAVGLADLGHYPGHMWMDRYEAYTNASILNFTAYQIRLLQSSVLKLDSLEPMPQDAATDQWKKIRSTKI
eukprot:gene10454-8409_t